ncbi:hypothetical protein GGH95_003685 [Coemansia sp. RSA 1836]|nr:hypothetical protein GGH95_003685 [Coemansia sp. RSA 1836]
MRFYIVLAIFSCLLALCSSTNVGINSGTRLKVIEVFDTLCYKLDAAFPGSDNKVAVSGYPTSFFANDDCTNLVTVAYHGWVFQPARRPIRSFSVLRSW